MHQEPLLPRATPSTRGVAAAGVSALLDALEARVIECHSMMVVRHGHVVAEGWWAPFSPDRPHLLYSLTKSFTSVAVGLAVHDGLLALDDRVVDVLADRVPDPVSPRAAQLTVHDLLSMSTGHTDDTLEAAWTLAPDDLVRGFLRVTPEQPPGSCHAYNNPTSYVLARMVERVTGRTLPDLLDERLFGPMGVRGAEWERLRGGGTFGFHGLYLTTEAVAAFGELLLREGRWRGRQLVPSDWVALATRRHIGTAQFEDGSRGADWLEGYGYHFWRSRHGFRGDGAMGQFCLVLPDADAVVAVTAATARSQDLLDTVWEYLLPSLTTAGDPARNQAGDAAGDGVGDPIRDRELAERSARLAIPMVVGDLRPDSRATGVVRTEDAMSALPAGSEIAVEPRPGGWTLRIDTGGVTVEVAVGHGEWRESSPLGRPVVAAGGWQGPTFVADLFVITGPSRIRLTVDASGAVARWNIPPLVGPQLIPQLRSPLITRPDLSGTDAVPASATRVR
ncbi:MAG: serine hydrolase [Actinocatenispora sp.]